MANKILTFNDVDCGPVLALPSALPPTEVIDTAISYPQFLDISDIENILNSLPTTLSAFPELSKSIDEQIRNRITLQLKQIQNLYPHSEKTQRFWITEIEKRWINAVVRPGRPVGSMLTSIIESFTQSALSQFHKSGSEGDVGGSIEAIIRAMNGNIRGDSRIYIFFYPEYRYDQLFKNMPHRFVNLTIGDVISQEPYVYDIPPENYSGETIPGTEDWYPLAENLWGKPVKNANKFIRLIFDIDLLYLYQYTTADIVKVLRSTKTNVMTLIPGPTTTGIVDVYLNINSLQRRESPLELVELWLASDLLPLLKTFRLGGIPGLSNIKTHFFELDKALQAEAVKDDTGRLYWTLNIKPHYRNEYGVTPRRIKNMITKVAAAGYWEIRDVDRLQIYTQQFAREINIPDQAQILRNLTFQFRINDDYLIFTENKSVTVNNKDINLSALRSMNLEIKSLDSNTSVITANVQNEPYLLTLPIVQQLINRTNELKLESRGDDNILYIGSRNGFKIKSDNRSQMNKFRTVLSRLGLRITGIRPAKLEIEIGLPADPSPTTILAKIRSDKIRTFFEQNSGDRYSNAKIPDDLENSIIYSYVSVSGTDMTNIALFSDVDTARIRTNNPRDTLEVLGLEAARAVIFDNFLIMMTGNVSTASDNDTKHVHLLADYMTRSGIAGVNFIGMKLTNQQDLTILTFERSTEMMLTVVPTYSSNSTSTSVGASLSGNAIFGSGYYRGGVAKRKKIGAGRLGAFYKVRASLNSRGNTNKKKPGEGSNKNEGTGTNPPEVIDPSTAFDIVSGGGEAGSQSRPSVKPSGDQNNTDKITVPTDNSTAQITNPVGFMPDINQLANIFKSAGPLAPTPDTGVLAPPNYLLQSIANDINNMKIDQVDPPAINVTTGGGELIASIDDKFPEQKLNAIGPS